MNEQDKKIYDKAVEEGRIPPLPTPDQIRAELVEAKKQMATAADRPPRKIELSPEQKAKNEAYLQRVLKAKKQGALQTKRIEREQLMNTTVAKVKIWEIICRRMSEKGEVFSFEKSPNLKEVLLNLTKYFIWDSSSAYDLTKGIWLTGMVGCGKSFLMDCFSEFTIANDLPTAFVMKSTSDIATEVRLHGADILQQYKQGNLSFDDVGEEDDARPPYGKDLNCMQEILFNLYAKHEKAGRTYMVTSNIFPCTREVLAARGWKVCPVVERYGERVKDRCMKMFFRVLIKGGSHRG